MCATGKHDEERSKEFENALKIAGVTKWFLADENIPKQGGIFLSDLDSAISNGLKSLNLIPEDIDLLITHPFYGDEHKHAQHSQLFIAMNSFCRTLKIPFGFFSSMTIPYFMLNPLATDMRRYKNTHVVNYCSCSGAWRDIEPKFFFQFKINHTIKNKMLKCYKSINQKEHQAGYASWDNSVEGFYFMEKNVFHDIYQNMDIPGGEGLFT